MTTITDLMTASMNDLAVAVAAVGHERRSLNGADREVAEELHLAAGTLASVARAAVQDRGASHIKQSEVWMRTYLGSLSVLTMAVNS